MENKTFYEQINLFLKNKGQENPRPTYAGMNLRTQPQNLHT